jgi:hypothetical protein
MVEGELYRKDIRLAFSDGSSFYWTLTDVGDPPPLKETEHLWLAKPILTNSVTVYVLSAYNEAT